MSGVLARAAVILLCAGSGLSRPAAAQAPAAGHGAELGGVWTGVTLPGTAEWAIYTFSAELPPLTEWGQARFDAAKPQRGPRGVPVTETDDLVYRCYPPGTPRVYLHPFPFEIIQLPGRIVIVFFYDKVLS